MKAAQRQYQLTNSTTEDAESIESRYAGDTSVALLFSAPSLDSVPSVVSFALLTWRYFCASVASI